MKNKKISIGLAVGIIIASNALILEIIAILYFGNVYNIYTIVPLLMEFGAIVLISNEINHPEISFESLFEEHQKFAKERFPESTWQSSLEGLKREIKEVEDADKSNLDAWLIEYIDCLKYLLDSMYRAGASINDIKRLFRKKLEINKNRQWSKNPDNSYSHIQ